ncbi:MAG TPA: M43 family zinc metalloprotease [Chitinophagaceae bacterium]|nr:M43 family zinc metalloprotease [Chitinophagaceae bacterium]
MIIDAGQWEKKGIVITFCVLTAVHNISGQAQRQVPEERCATMQVLEERVRKNPQLKIRMEQQRDEFNKAVKDGFYKLRGNDQAAETITIPVIFHIVMTNPSSITQQQILSQLDTLNKSFGGINGDSTKIPSYFKPLFGKSQLRFCLAQQTPDDEPSTGIERYVTTVSSFGTNDAVKHSSTGGADAWNTEKYFNVWICVLSNGVLGYATFPDDGSPDEQGVVIDYLSLPGGSANNYNNGKTLVHEAGHYFNLYHIWGDDDGACNGTDYVDDTPNQANSTSGCYSGIRTDNCTSSGNGIMYQNYMDYSYDNCMVMYTTAQVTRMEAAFLIYRSALNSSNGCSAVELKTFDASPVTIQQPAQRICNNTFSPVVTIRNKGSQTITSLQIISKVDNGQSVSFTWTGSLSSLNSTGVTLNPVTVTEGEHTLIIYTAGPNNTPDENNTNDTLEFSFEYNPAQSPELAEGFEGSVFPPEGWHLINPDDAITWQKITGVAKTGNASVYISNYDYENSGQKDFLQLPEFQFNNEDSAFLSFDLAATTYSPFNTANNIWDTLEVLISTDCGTTYTTVYKKWGSELVTVSNNSTNAFIPQASDWRRDSVNLKPYLQYGKFLIAFANTTGWENNIYLDNVNLRTVTVNPNLKEQGFLVTPNPTNGIITIQFYPQPSGLKGIQIFNYLGQKVAETMISSEQANTSYTFDLNRYAAGIYIVRAVFDKEVRVKKIIRY